MSKGFLIAALLATGATSASAQVVTYKPQLDPDRFVLTADPKSIALTESARPLRMKEFALGLALRVGAPPLQLCVRDGSGADDCAQDGNLVSSRFGADLVGAFGFGRAGVYAQLPVILYQGSDFDEMGAGQLRVSGIGDLRIGGKVLIGEIGPSSIALDAHGQVPTGGGDFTGDGGTTIEGRLVYEYRKNKISLAAALGYSWRQKASRIANLYVDDEMLWSAGGEYKLTETVSAGLSVFGRVGLMKDPAAPTAMQDPSWEERPAELMASTRWWATKQIAVEAAASTGLTDGYGALAFRALAGVRWMQARPEPPADLDWDHDSIPNDVDQCPRVAEDFDQFADEDGCPEPDNDKDGIVDRTDKCPNDPEDFDKFEDDDGCPELDNDKDLILDKDDKCPLDPEDRDAFEDEDGCPELDNDKDGILDTADKCPMDPEDKDGFEDADGCPEPDNDHDGLLDAVDKCPDEPETYNGVDDADGCPDAKPTVVVTSTKVEIKETVYFDLDKATIKPISFKLLNGVASALKAYATLEIEVQGHTDDLADDNYNMKLSQRRAEAVRAYLIKQGIDAKRLTAKGYGETLPAVPGKTKEARDQNRRVEFVITNAATPAPAPGTGGSTIPAPPPTPTPAPAGPVTKP